jgi:hypothetical protein
VIRMRNFYPRFLLKLSQQAWLLKESLLPGGANQFAGGTLRPLESSASSRRTIAPTIRVR